MPLASPTFAIYSLLPIIKAITAVDPVCLHYYGYIFAYLVSVVANAEFMQFLIVVFKSSLFSIPVRTSSSYVLSSKCKF